MNGASVTHAGHHRVAVLAAIAVGSVVLWQTQIGSLVLYPFTILATWFHEMGHGLAAMLVGSDFDHLVIHADGSGYAVSSRPSDAYRLTSAFIAAAGPMGPAIAGSLLIVASRHERNARHALNVLGVALLVSTIIWIRSLVGWVAMPAIGLAILGVARIGRPGMLKLTAQVLGVQAGISAWRSFDYLFSAAGSVGGAAQRSDTSAIADALLLPYWFWGAGISAAIVALMVWSVSRALRR